MVTSLSEDGVSEGCGGLGCSAWDVSLCDTRLITETLAIQSREQIETHMATEKLGQQQFQQPWVVKLQNQWLQTTTPSDQHSQPYQERAITSKVSVGIQP